MPNKNIKYVIFFAIAFLAVVNSLFVVKESEQAITLQFGQLIKVSKEPGLHFKVPFIQNVIYFDKKVLDIIDEEKELTAADQKKLIISAYAKYKIIDPVKIYQTVTDQVGLKSRITSIFNSSLREVIGNEPLAALLTDKRSKIMGDIQNLMNAKSKGFGIDVMDVRISRADLPVENSAAIYARMRSDREKEAKRIRAQGDEKAQIIRSKAEKEKTILLAEAYKKSTKLQGEGDAEATKIYASAFKMDPEFYNFYRSLEAYKKSFNKKDTTLYLSSSDGFLRLFNK
ncbi:MAG: protease modulator HflC [Alphaproteobacteria bacterium]|nr:protease modulator HflC [Alphaproteobacteria bacterium]